MVTTRTRGRLLALSFYANILAGLMNFDVKPGDK